MIVEAKDYTRTDQTCCYRPGKDAAFFNDHQTEALARGNYNDDLFMWRKGFDAGQSVNQCSLYRKTVFMGKTSLFHLGGVLCANRQGEQKVPATVKSYNDQSDWSGCSSSWRGTTRSSGRSYCLPVLFRPMLM